LHDREGARVDDAERGGVARHDPDATRRRDRDASWASADRDLLRSREGSAVQHGGALARAIDTDRQRAVKDVFRWNLPFAEQLYCDTVRIHDGLAVGVLTDRPSDGRFDILEDIEPAWKDREEFCAPP
jgi:hypothetical protein